MRCHCHSDNPFFYHQYAYKQSWRGWFNNKSGKQNGSSHTLINVWFSDCGSFLSTLLIIINRFNKNVFGREGYLTLTLPVTAHQIILSKLLASFVCSIFNGINLLIGIFILIAPTVDFTYLLKVLKTIMKPENLVENASILIYMLLSTITSILLIYLAISIGQLFSNRRGLMAFCAYFILVIIIIVVMTYLNDAFFTVNPNSSDSLLYFGDHTAISILNIEQLVEGIILYVATHFIIKNKLNIQW